MNDSTSTPQPEPLDEVEATKQPFTEHLRELRTRTIRALAYVIVGLLVAWMWHEDLYRWLMEPYQVAMHALDEARDDIGFRSPIEPVMVYLKTSLLVGALASAPLVLLEGWLFVAPGLYARERRLAVPFLLWSVIFFLGGVAFCRYVVLEPAMQVLLGFGGEGTSAIIMMDDYFAFSSKLLFVFGALFELPVLVSFLSLVGLIDHHWLIRNWKYSVIGAFVLGAMLTPPDPLTQVALAVPLVLLYVISIGLAYLITSRRSGAADEP